jgi:predicted acylesterase/phospholipase RssA
MGAVGPTRAAGIHRDSRLPLGITFVEKGDRTRPRPHAKVAVVLAGGAVTGGAFKIGGLVALNTLLENKGVTDFDIYVGISAGAFLAAPLAAGVSPEEMLASLEGQSPRIDRFSPIDFYRPNWREFASKPFQLARDMVLTAPAATVAGWSQLTAHRPELLTRARDFLRAPCYQTAEALVEPFITETIRHSRLRPGLSYLPAGVFDNRGIERYLRRQFDKNNVPNDFRLLHMECDKSLYIGATNLNTADGVVFGHDEDNSVTISEAVQASTAIPGFYRPARIRGQDYIDAGVRRTANISQATKRGASLVICYNPFRPFVNYHTDQLLNGNQTISDMGIGTVINQAFRTMLHTRLLLGIEKLQLNPDFHGDIILLEPSETDVKFFNMNPLNFWQRAESALHGYISATEAIERHHTRIEAILRSYGIKTNLQRMRDRIERIRKAGFDERAIMKELMTDLHPPREAVKDAGPKLRVVR